MLLALDTATHTLSIAVSDGQALLAEHTWHAGNHHSVELAPQVALLLRRAEVTPARLQAVVVAIGPGSYTGLRIGLGFAKGLALAHGLALVGVPTFEPLMRAQPGRAGAERALALLQAGRGRVSAAPYRWSARRQRWEADGAASVMDWAALAAGIETPTYVCGEIDPAGAEALRAKRGVALLASPALCLRRAGFLAEIGWERLRTGTADDAARLAPLYGGQPEGVAA